MIGIAQEYYDQIRDKVIHTWYDPKYMYYAGGPGDFVPELPVDNYSSHNFVSLNSCNEVIGCISYAIKWDTMSVEDLSILCFSDNTSEGNIFLKDTLKIINDIFYKHSMNRIEFWCYDDNPAIRGYRRFIKKAGGREVGTFKEVAKLQDGRLHDKTFFEILHSDWVNKGINPKYFEDKEETK